jgi:hypothetical protein
VARCENRLGRELHVFRMKANLAVAFELRFWIIQGCLNGDRRKFSLSLPGKTCLTYQRTKTGRAVPGRFFRLPFWQF